VSADPDIGAGEARAPAVTGIILAGGQGRRMGGVDKGLELLRGKPMVLWVIERLAPQVAELLINANQNIEAYARFGRRVIPDEIAGFAGPLAGLHRGLTAASHDWVVTCPCDSPFLPTDLVVRLYQAAAHAGAELAVAKTGEQAHPVFALCRRTVLPGLGRFLVEGGRKIDAWYAALRVVEVPFDDQPAAFSNINTSDELRRYESGGLPG
jgi:molybdenum cofactor guanylyltransferase